MSFNGSGTFVVNTAGQPVVPNTVISATAFNALTADLANGLSTCITKDGQTTPTANIPMGNNKITGLAPGTSGTDAANLSQVQGSTAKLLQSVTGTDTITAAMVPALTSYSAGQMFYFVAVGDNTGAVTINIDSLGAKSVTRDGSTALVAGDIVSGEIALIVYDGTRFQLLNGNSFTNLNVSGTLAVGSTSTFTGAATFTANPTLSGGTANGVLYLNGSKVATSGSALVFDGTNLTASRGLKAASAGVAVSSFVDGLSVGGYDSIGFLASPGNALAIGGYRTSQWSGLEFYTSGSLQATLTSTGLGIGTASPARKLIVADTNAAMGLVSANTGYSELYFSDASGSPGALSYNHNNDTLNFYTNSNNRATIDSSGNLGLGVTPSGWSGVNGVFEIKGNAYVYSTTGVLSSGANAYFNGTNWIYKTTQAATRYEQVNGAHQWGIAPSGTAGNAITFTQAMTLDASGRLKIEANASAPNDASGFWLTNQTGIGPTISGLSFTVQTGSTGSQVERIRLESSGYRFGLGTTSVNSNGGSGSTVLHLHNPSASEWSILHFTNGTTGVNAGDGTIVGVIGTDSSFQIYNYENSAIIFSTNNAGVGRFTEGGNFLVGTTSDNGSASNAARVNGGIFSTVNGTTGTATSGVATTLFTSVNDGTYIVTAQLTGSSPTSYTAVAIVKAGGGTLTSTNLSTATLMTITVSGTSVQATQSSGAGQNIAYSAIRIA